MKLWTLGLGMVLEEVICCFYFSVRDGVGCFGGMFWWDV